MKKKTPQSFRVADLSAARSSTVPRRPAAKRESPDPGSGPSKDFPVLERWLGMPPAEFDRELRRLAAGHDGGALADAIQIFAEVHREHLANRPTARP